MQPQIQKRYAHIEGLRGWAIVLVVLFHYTIGNDIVPNATIVKNGFLGVDMFVCIMGYLCIRGLTQKKEMLFLQYLNKKIIRLFAPLAILVTIAALLAIFILDFNYIKLLADTGLYSLFGLANAELIWKSKNYFATDSAMNALLHTWYISVAIQLFVLAYVLKVLLRNAQKRTIGNF